MSDRYTDEQRRSIEHLGSHSITHACAGSGKTAMLVGRVRFLLEQGIPAERIRALGGELAAGLGAAQGQYLQLDREPTFA
jgi:DNA helicase-2/ATP-dependent DNA helicase PcrA